MGLRLAIALGLLFSFVIACADDTPDRGSDAPILIIAPTSVVPGPEAIDAADPVLVASLDDALTVLAVTLEAMVDVDVEVARVGVKDDLAKVLDDARPAVVVVVDADRFERAPWTVPALEPGGALDPDEPQHDDRFVLETRRLTVKDTMSLDGGEPVVVTLASKTRLGRQYAIYELLRRVGARYYHPEDEWLPSVPAAQLPRRLETPTVLGAGPIFRPDFVHRSYTFHAAHPLEQLESFSDARHPIAEARNVNDWIIKNRGDIFRGAGRGVAPSEAREQRVTQLESLRKRRGLRLTTGITLHNQQQGASADLDPTSPVPLEEQARALVTERLEATPDAYAFSIHFGPTELTTTPDRETVALIDAAGQAALALRPDLGVEVNDHTSGSQPVDHYDDLGCPPGTNDRGVVDYYDLAFHTDPRFAVRVHTVMFHPLEGPAGVYGQESFAHKLCLMQKASDQGRPLVYFPESAYWLSWDNAIPVYLPLYLYSRWRDMQLIRPLLLDQGGSLRDHRLFDSGHEWGYWQADYAVGLLHWKSDLSLDAVLGELADPLCAVDVFPDSCPAKTTYVEVLREVMDSQREHFLNAPDSRGKPGGLYTMFAGEDPADELGAASGLEFRPVRVPFREVFAMSQSDLAHFVTVDLDRLVALAADYTGWRDRLVALRPDVPEDARRFLDETIDGLAIDALRARHTDALYRAVIALRDASPESPAVTAELTRAEDTLAEAEVVIRRREAAYRYPAAQTHGGGLTPDTAVPNGTTYPYRVHTKTHLLTYWHNRQDQVADLIAGRATDPTALTLSPVFAPADAPLAFTWPALDGLTGALELSGPGAPVSVPALTATMTLPAPGIYRVSGQLETSSAPLGVQGAVVRSDSRARVAPGDFQLDEPDSSLARTVLSSLVPLLRVAFDGETGRLALLAEPAGADTATFQQVVVASADARDDTVSSAPFDLGLPIPDPSTGRVALTVGLTGAVFTAPLGAFDGGEARLAGRLSVDDLVAALVTLAGFEPTGAIETLAGVLGFDPANPPADVPFSATLLLTAE